MQSNFSVRNVYGDHMVFQRGQPIAIVGTAPARSTVVVRFAGKSLSVAADEAAVWEAVLPAMEAGGPYELVVANSAGATVTFRDILVGEVWFCSGQSNMEFPVCGDNYFFALRDGKDVAANARDDKLRLFHTQHAVSPDGPCDEAPAGCAWKAATTPEAVGQFSAVGYWFGVFLRQKLGDVPVGMIHSSWGGTLIEPWISKEAFVEAGRAQEILQVESAQRLCGQTTEDVQEEYRQKVLSGMMGLRDSQQTPTTLYNAMVHPFTVLNVRGFIWYQGCSNTGNPKDYRVLQPLLIDCWRKAWGNPEAAFILTQLSAFQQHSPDNRLADDFWMALQPEDSGYAQLRDVQASMRSYPNTGVAVTIDIGDHSDIHPHNKKDVAFRLEREAERLCYGNTGITAGPHFASMSVVGGKIRVSFTNVGGGLVAKGGVIGEHNFAIAGADGNYVWAEAKLDGDTVVVWSPEVPKPVNVRYAWSMFPPNPNLYNAEGFPMSPFRTDA